MNGLTASRRIAIGFFLCLGAHAPAIAQDSDASASFSAQPLNSREEAESWVFRQRAFPLGYIPAGVRARAFEQIKQAEQARSSGGGGGGFEWFSLGPAPILDGPTVPPSIVSGRVTSIAVDPTDEDHWLIGAAQGGVWETDDAGMTWSPKTDDQDSLATGAISFAPNNPQIIYVGTGEANFSGDSYAGAGLLKSIDGGASWTLLATDRFSQTAFSDIKVHPSNPDTVVVATARGIQGPVSLGTDIPPNAPPRGIFRSINGGTSWSRRLTGEATDLEVDPNNFNRQYAGLGEPYGHSTNGVYRSTDAGQTWSPITGPWAAALAQTNVGRVEMAIAPSSPDTLYVAMSTRRTVEFGDSLLGIWGTSNAWSTTPTWTALPNTFTPKYTWYCFELSVDPANSEILYLGSLDLKRYASGSWTTLASAVHADQHALAWIRGAGGDRLLVGNDGGIWSSGVGVNSWNNHNEDLAITQIYEGSVHPDSGVLALAGTQDNGTLLWTGDEAWQWIWYGDGGDNAISSVKPDTDWAVSYQTHQGINIYRTKDAGVNITYAAFGISATDAPFFVRFEKHPTLNDLFIAGTVNLWKCANFFSSPPQWTSNGPTLLKSDGKPSEITALAFAPSDVNGQTYAYGTEDGQLRITSNGGANWADLDPANSVPGRYITDLAFDPTTASVLYVTLSGFDDGTPGQPGHLFKTSDALGVSPAWSNISPSADLPHNTIAINPDGDQLFVGTDIGVWQGPSNGQLWTHHGPQSGMPNVAVFELQMDTLGRLTAFTHGRGAFAYKLSLPNIKDYVACPLPCQLGWINPGDLVTFEFPLRDIITVDTRNLTARLRATADITPLTGAQTYGMLQVNGPPVSKSFAFMAGAGAGGLGSGLAPTAVCGDIVYAILDLEDDGVDLGSVKFPFRLGRPNVLLLETFETLIPPALPTGWRRSLVGAGDGWVTTTNPPPNSFVQRAPGGPDHVNDPPVPRPGPLNFSVFAPAPDRLSEMRLESPSLVISNAGTQFSFRHSFDFESDFDGGALEISIGGEPFLDFERAGGSFTESGYNATLRGAGALSGRHAWTGNSGGYLVTHASLPHSALGHPIQLRWLCATDDSRGGNGWFVDDIRVEEFLCLAPVTEPVRLLHPRLERGQIHFSVETVSGRTYIIQFKTDFNDLAWQTLLSFVGDGTERAISDATAAGRAFYRAKVE